MVEHISWKTYFLKIQKLVDLDQGISILALNGTVWRGITTDRTTMEIDPHPVGVLDIQYRLGLLIISMKHNLGMSMCVCYAFVY